MKLKKSTFSIVSLFLTIIMLALSAIFVYSAQQQSMTTSLTVNFNGQNVNFTAEGWYHVQNSESRVELVDGEADADNKIKFSAGDGPTTKNLSISTASESNKVTLTADNTYVLFTYKFTNTATSGAFGMEVSLSLTNVGGSNLKAVKYGTGTELYTNSASGLSSKRSALSTFTTPNSGAMEIFSDDFIVAGGTDTNASGTGIKYYYILFELDDDTLPVNFNPTFNWTVTCSEDVVGRVPTLTLSFTNCDHILETRGLDILGYVSVIDNTDYVGARFYTTNSLGNNSNYSFDIEVLPDSNVVYIVFTMNGIPEFGNISVTGGLNLLRHGSGSPKNMTTNDYYYKTRDGWVYDNYDYPTYNACYYAYCELDGSGNDATITFDGFDFND